MSDTLYLFAAAMLAGIGWVLAALTIAFGLWYLALGCEAAYKAAVRRFDRWVDSPRRWHGWPAHLLESPLTFETSARRRRIDRDESCSIVCPDMDWHRVYRGSQQLHAWQAYAQHRRERHGK